jgi:hypothetical protein
MFLEIVALTKEISHYQRYMEYLAGEKAHELVMSPQVKQTASYRNPVVEKVYKANQSKVEHI